MRARGIRVAAQLGSRPPTDARATELDFVATSFPHFVPRLRAAGMDAEYLPLAFDPRVLDRLRAEGVDPSPDAERPHAVVFVGGIHGPSVHQGGTALLERLARELDMEVWGYVDDRLSSGSPLLQSHHGEAWGLEMYRVLARARVAVNRHGDIAEGHANNMRLFEATGAGALLATEQADNLSELFEPGREVLAYEDPDDLIDQVRHHLDRDEERRAVAAAGQRRTLTEHGYGRRIATLAGMLGAAALMRVLVVDTYYAGFLEEHYGARPGLGGRPYSEQLAALMERSFGTSDAFSSGFRAAGHEAAEVVANCLPIQARWAAEHGAARAGRAAARLPGRAGSRARGEVLRRIAREQVTDFGADVVLCQDMSFFERSDLDAMRADGRVVVGQIASPPPDDERLRGHDLILTSFPHFVERFRALGVDSEYLRLAFHSAVLDRLGQAGRERPRGLTFVGSVDPRVHAEGVALLEHAARELPLEAFGYGAEQLQPGSALRAAHGGEAWGLDMYRLLAESRVTLNRHIAAAEGKANNMRLYEATGVGALLHYRGGAKPRGHLRAGARGRDLRRVQGPRRQGAPLPRARRRAARDRGRRPGPHAARAHLRSPRPRARGALGGARCGARRRSARRLSWCDSTPRRAPASRASAAAAPCGSGDVA